MDPIKEAFLKAKADITNLQEEITLLKNEILTLKAQFRQTNQQTDTNLQSQNTEIPTQELTELSNLPLKALKTSISSISKGNEGVPTNRQTNQQTDRQLYYLDNKEEIHSETDSNSPLMNQFKSAITSIDYIKSTLKSKFKSLTKQELLVYTTIYQLDELGNTVDYPTLSAKLGLSESSIRDYTFKLIKKSIPLTKKRVDNKKIILEIPNEFKKISSLSSILSLSQK